MIKYGIKLPNNPFKWLGGRGMIKDFTTTNINEAYTKREEFAKMYPNCIYEVAIYLETQ